MVQKLAVIDILNFQDYPLSLMLALGPARVVFYYGPDFRRQRRTFLDRLARAGLETVYVDDSSYQAAEGHDFHLCDYQKVVEARRAEPARGPAHSLIRRLKARGKRLICYPHSLEVGPISSYPSLEADDFFISPHEALFYRVVENGRIWRDRDDIPVVGQSPTGWETFIGAPIHHDGQALSLRLADKKTLREELAERLKVKFRPGRPLIAHFSAIHCDSRSYDRGLARLARRADIVLKLRLPDSLPRGNPLHFQGDYQVKGEGIHATHDDSFNHLIRYASDLVLADYRSSGALSCLFLDLRLVITHTWLYVSFISPQPSNYTYNLRYPQIMQSRLAYCLSPLHIEGADLIMDRLADEAYWARFQAELPRLRRGVLGAHWLGDQGQERTARFINLALDRGSLLPSGPESSAYKLDQGPGRLEPPTDLTL